MGCSNSKDINNPIPTYQDVKDRILELKNVEMPKSIPFYADFALSGNKSNTSTNTNTTKSVPPQLPAKPPRKPARPSRISLSNEPQELHVQKPAVTPRKRIKRTLNTDDIDLDIDDSDGEEESNSVVKEVKEVKEEVQAVEQIEDDNVEQIEDDNVEQIEDDNVEQIEDDNVEQIEDDNVEKIEEEIVEQIEEEIVETVDDNVEQIEEEIVKTVDDKNDIIAISHEEKVSSIDNADSVSDFKDIENYDRNEVSDFDDEKSPPTTTKANLMPLVENNSPPKPKRNYKKGDKRTKNTNEESQKV